MKIVHVCLCGPVSDNWGYQENLLTKYQMKLGHEVTLIAPQWAWGNEGKMVKMTIKEYYNSDGVKMIRLPIKGEKNITYTFKKFIGLLETLEKEVPDIIFIHNVQFLDMKNIVKYLKQKSKVKVFVDNHADYTNSAKNWLSKYFLYGIIWKHCAQIIEPFTKKFYGVLPSRVDFIIENYKIPPTKVGLLVMGADDELVKASRLPEVKRRIREEYGILEDDFLIVSGGKIDGSKKQTLLLMKAVRKINHKNIKLIVFGSVTPELKDSMEQLVDGENVQYIGWINSSTAYQYFAAADLVVFPGRHSVFWEQVVGLGIPMLCKYWKGSTHVDIGGNVGFLKNDSPEEIISAILELINHPDIYENMKNVAEEIGMEIFSYMKIAEKSISE